MTTYAYSSETPADVKAGLLIVPVFQGPKPGPGVRETGPARAYADSKLTGKKGESVLVTRRDRDRFAAGAVLLVGVGPKDELTIEGMRRALGRAAGTARRFASVATTFPQAFGARQAADAVQAAAEGLGLGDYRFDRYRTKREDATGLKRVVVVGNPKWEARGLAAAVKRASHRRRRRLLGARPREHAGGRHAARRDRPRGAAHGPFGRPHVQGLERVPAREGRVRWHPRRGQGGVNPPRLIELTYTGAGDAAPIALTGKGIAFDSGGLSIKDAKGMETMKDDMGGAASILGTMKAIARLKPKINAIAAIPCSENMPSGSAQKPGDAITHRGGKNSRC